MIVVAGCSPLQVLRATPEKQRIESPGFTNGAGYNLNTQCVWKISVSKCIEVERNALNEAVLQYIHSCESAIHCTFVRVYFCSNVDNCIAKVSDNRISNA